MRVLVTGGTGFVGSHAVAALQREGHEVRLLAREPARVRAALDPLGATADDVIFGDVTDQDVVRQAVQGCDAVIHSASVYSLRPSDWARIRAVNVVGTQTVLESALEAGCAPVVHVSSIVAIMPSQPGSTMTPDSPVTSGYIPGAYAQSKAESEHVARRLQDQGAPVVVVYPGGVFGPHDPYLGESNRALRDQLRGLSPAVPTGGFHTADVRDVATTLVRALNPPRTPSRYLVPGHYLGGTDGVQTLSEVTGRRLRTVRVPSRLLLASLGPVEALAARSGRPIPGLREPLWLLSKAAPADASATETDLGVTARPLAETFADTVRWLHASGHVSRRAAGRLAA